MYDTLSLNLVIKVTACCFSSDGQNIISASGDKTIRVWNAQTGKCVQILRGHLEVVRS